MDRNLAFFVESSKNVSFSKHVIPYGALSEFPYYNGTNRAPIGWIPRTFHHVMHWHLYGLNTVNLHKYQEFGVAVRS